MCDDSCKRQPRIALLAPTQLLDLMEALSCVSTSGRDGDSLLRVYGYMRSMVPDAVAAVGGAAAGTSHEVYIWRAVCSAVDAKETRAAIPNVGRATINVVVSVVTKVVDRLRKEGVLLEVDPMEERDKAPVVLQGLGRPEEWWYKALMYTMGGPWLPR